MRQPTARTVRLDDRTPRLLLIEDRLGESLARYVESRRPKASWRRIALDLGRLTNVDVTGEWLRVWFTRDDEGEDAA